jgi:hypothetical protein
MRGISLVLAIATTLACGRVVPRGGEPIDGQAKPRPRTIEATDLIPADLDLVVRLDLAKMRASFAPGVARELADKGLDESRADAPVRAALQTADVVWLGVRVADLASGDRVLVTESLSGTRDVPDSIAWKRHATPIDGIHRFEAKAPPPRSGTAEILSVGRSAVFVSPIEAPSVKRLLARGPDAGRCEPDARGLLSIDYRPKRISRELAERHAPLARILAGIDRVQAVVDVTGKRLDLSARIGCKSELYAERVAQFLGAFRSAGEPGQRYAELLGTLQIDRRDRTVVVRWSVASDTLFATWLPPPSSPPPSESLPDEP